MPQESDIEKDYKPIIEFPCPIDGVLEVFMPKMNILAKNVALAAPSGGDTFVFTDRFRSEAIQNSIEICLNKSNLLNTLALHCDLGKIKTSFECDFQLALDKKLFDKTNIHNRIVWTTESERISPSDGLVNFYSSRLANHTPDTIATPSFELTVPHSLSQSIFFDFECPTTATDHENRSVPRAGLSAAEWNLRSVNIFGRVLVRYKIYGYTIVLRSDLHKFAKAVLLGSFAIQEKNPRVSSEERVFSGQEYVPQGILMHVFVGQGAAGGFVGNGPTFSEGKSSHYVVSDRGLIWKYVDEDRKASHAAYVTQDTVVAWKTYLQNGHYSKGTWEWNHNITDANPNYDTIGIEHEGLENTAWPIKKYCASGWLTQDIYSRWSNIELNNSRILPHRTVNHGKTCPGTAVELDRIISIANGHRERLRSANEPPTYR